MKSDNNRFYLLLLCGLLLVAMNSCGHQEVVNPYADEYSNRCTLEKVGERIYNLDDNTSCLIEYIQFIDEDSIQLFALLNSYKNAIYLYDAQTGVFKDTIPFQLEGNDGVGKLQGFFYHNPDSIFTYQYGSGQIALANAEGKVKQRFSLFDMEKIMSDTLRLLPNPSPKTYAPIFYHEGLLTMVGSLYLESSFETAENSFVSLHFNINNGGIQYSNPYPEMYRKYNWSGAACFREVCASMDRQGNLLLSYPADHFLWRYNPVSQTRDSVYAGSRYVKSIRPFSTEAKSLMFNDPPEDAINDWNYREASYEEIYYDRYRDLYYRIVRLPRKEGYERGFISKPVSIIVLDKNLQYVGEQILPDNLLYDTFNAYVAPDGLFIHIYTPYDEDHLHYYQYQVRFAEE